MDMRSALAMLLQRGTRADYPTSGLPFQRPPQLVGMRGGAPAEVQPPAGRGIVTPGQEAPIQRPEGPTTIKPGGPGGSLVMFDTPMGGQLMGGPIRRRR